MNRLRMAATLVALVTSIPAFSQPITAVLRLKEKISMETLAENVRSPASARYGQPYEPEEIRDLAAPSTEEYQALISQLRLSGFQVVTESKTHLWVSVTADSSLFDKTFGSHIQTLGAFHINPAGANLLQAQMQTQNQAHAVSGSQVVVQANPSELLAGTTAALNQVEAVVGLDNTRKSIPLFVQEGGVTNAPQGIPQATIKSAYGFNSIYKAGITGLGQDIAVATYNSFNISDVKSFYSLSALKPGPSLDQMTFNGTPKTDGNSAIETELDAEFSGMMAPGARIHVFTSATNDDAGELALFTAILDDNRAKVVNYSWGDCENNVSSQHKTEMSKVFARAVAQGVNIMVASGDSGSDGCRNKTVDADWPAANPDVVAVGGTTFQQQGNEVSETAWSGSGGGISGLFSLPSWQKILGSPYLRRSYPDVSFNADPQSGESVYTQVNGQLGWIVIGGTSMAAPQWSGFMALVGQARRLAGKHPLGFLNPLIYDLSSSEKDRAFHDVTSGSNGAYKAGPSWDAVTGWGSMQADTLLEILSGI